MAAAKKQYFLRCLYLTDSSPTSFNPSSPKGGWTNPPTGFRPGAQNRTAKG